MRSARSKREPNFNWTENWTNFVCRTTVRPVGSYLGFDFLQKNRLPFQRKIWTSAIVSRISSLSQSGHRRPATGVGQEIDFNLKTLGKTLCSLTLFRVGKSCSDVTQFLVFSYLTKFVSFDFLPRTSVYCHTRDMT